MSLRTLNEIALDSQSKLVFMPLAYQIKPFHASAQCRLFLQGRSRGLVTVVARELLTEAHKKRGLAPSCLPSQLSI